MPLLSVSESRCSLVADTTALSEVLGIDEASPTVSGGADGPCARFQLET